MRSKLSKWLAGAAMGCAAIPALAEKPRDPLSQLPPPSMNKNEIVQVQAPVTSSIMPAGTFADAGDCKPGGFYVGAGVYFLQPHFESNPAFSVATLNPNSITITQREFDQGLNAAPTAWIGYENESGLGGRFRYFYFSGDDTQTVANFNGPALGAPLAVLPPGAAIGAIIPGFNAGTPFSVAATSKLRIQTFDLEATQRFGSGAFTGLITAGVRYANMSQDYSLTGTAFAGGVPVLASTFAAGHNFNGWGPTMSLEGHRQIASSPLGLYALGRASVLFGKSSQIATASTGFLPGASLDIASSNTDTIPVGELEIGAEYGRSFGRFFAFGQIGFVGQTWLGAGNASVTTDTVGILNPGDNTSNLGLVGFVLRAGLNF